MWAVYTTKFPSDLILIWTISGSIDVEDTIMLTSTTAKVIVMIATKVIILIRYYVLLVCLDATLLVEDQQRRWDEHCIEGVTHSWEDYEHSPPIDYPILGTRDCKCIIGRTQTLTLWSIRSCGKTGWPTATRESSRKERIYIKWTTELCSYSRRLWRFLFTLQSCKNLHSPFLSFPFQKLLKPNLIAVMASFSDISK